MAEAIAPKATLNKIRQTRRNAAYTSIWPKSTRMTGHGTQGTLGLSAGRPRHESTPMTYMRWERYLEDIGVPTDALAPQLAP